MQDASWEDIAKALGHSVEHTQKHYGSVGQGKRRQKPVVESSADPKPDQRKEQGMGIRM